MLEYQFRNSISGTLAALYRVTPATSLAYLSLLTFWSAWLAFQHLSFPYSEPLVMVRKATQWWQRNPLNFPKAVGAVCLLLMAWRPFQSHTMAVYCQLFLLVSQQSSNPHPLNLSFFQCNWEVCSFMCPQRPLIFTFLARFQEDIVFLFLFGFYYLILSSINDIENISRKMCMLYWFEELLFFFF